MISIPKLNVRLPDRATIECIRNLSVSSLNFNPVGRVQTGVMIVCESWRAALRRSRVLRNDTFDFPRLVPLDLFSRVYKICKNARLSPLTNTAEAAYMKSQLCAET
jgi:hypothetical protein